MQTILISLLRFYQRWISPMLGQRCRYYPTCSEYTLTAVETHGIGRGLWLGIKRLCRCHPWHEGGFDPVPDTCEKDHCHG